MTDRPHPAVNAACRLCDWVTLCRTPSVRYRVCLQCDKIEKRIPLKGGWTFMFLARELQS